VRNSQVGQPLSILEATLQMEGIIVFPSDGAGNRKISQQNFWTNGKRSFEVTVLNNKFKNKNTVLSLRPLLKLLNCWKFSFTHILDYLNYRLTSDYLNFLDFEQDCVVQYRLNINVYDLNLSFFLISHLFM